jgi:phage baseplate assembly protein V
MPIGRDILDQLGQLMRPIATRVANTVARGVVQLVDDSKKQQLVQLGVLDGEDVDTAEHFQPYGFYSVPLVGAEAVVVFPNGDRSHPLVVAVADRGKRPTGGQAGEVGIYGPTGARVIMMANGDIEVRPAPGHEVLVRDASDAVDRLVKRGEFLAHGHATAATGPVSPPIAATPLADTGQFPGSQRLRAQ